MGGRARVRVEGHDARLRFERPVPRKGGYLPHLTRRQPPLGHWQWRKAHAIARRALSHFGHLAESRAWGSWLEAVEQMHLLLRACASWNNLALLQAYKADYGQVCAVLKAAEAMGAAGDVAAGMHILLLLLLLPWMLHVMVPCSSRC